MEFNKLVARQMTDAQNERDVNKLQEILAPNFKSHISDRPYPLNRDQYIQGVLMSHMAFRDLKFTIEDMVGEGEKVVLRIKAKGLHSGLYLGIAATQREVEFAGFAIRRIIEGKVVEEWQTNDQLHLLRQLGEELK